MTNTIQINPPKQITVNVTGIKIQNANVAPDNSGNWNVAYSLNTTGPSISSIEGVTVRQTYINNGSIRVTKNEILSSLALPVSGSTSDIAFGQLEMTVTSIAVEKIYQSLGL